MKIKLLFILLLTSVFLAPAVAQQKIRDNTLSGEMLPDKDALLELESTNKGLLLTWVKLIRADDAAPLSQHRLGMVVYNTATVNDVVPGIYYNTGERWLLIAAGNTTSITYNPVTHEITYVNQNEETQVINLEEVVKAVETVTVLDYDPASHVITYQDESGAPHTLDLTVGSLSYDKALHKLTYKAEDGTSTPLPLNNTDFSYDPTTHLLTYTNTLGVQQTEDLSDIVKKLETLTEIQVNSDNRHFHYKDEKGNTTNLDLMPVVKNLETLTSITENTDGTFTYRDEKGDPQIINIANLESLTGLQYDPLNHMLTYTDENGTPHELMLNNTRLTYDASLSELVYTDSRGEENRINLANIIRQKETMTSINGNVVEDSGNALFRITYTDENSSNTAVDIGATNGLSIDGTTGNVKLGGPITENTVIETDNSNTLAITGLKYSTESNDKIVVADASTGVLKALKAAMPKFFYMPSVIIPTAPEQLSSGNGEIDLYAIYAEQFGSPKKSSPDAPPLPVLPKNELFYYITWFDEAVFDNVSVDENGVMMYHVKPDADFTVGSFMNIVFAVK